MKFDELGRLDFFRALGAADLKLLAPYFTPQSLSADTVVFEQGDCADFLYLVVHGEVVIRYKPDDGPEMTVTCVQPGGIFGWSAAMGNPTYTSGAICSMDSEVVRIRGMNLRILCEKHPVLGKVILERLAAVIAERKKKTQEQVTSILANGIRQQGNARGGINDGSR